MKFCGDFRYDLEVGQVAEKLLANIFKNKTIEVKNDLKALKTGNLFIEYHSRGKPSGISTTQAEYWCFLVKDVFILIRTDDLKDILRPLFNTKADIKGGDNNTSSGILLKIEQLIKGQTND
jgi:hypothetical protein|tara:strand:- start:276 stop:638 length:363 start_codon:yes stop_codon:yes gene_type:complete